MPAPAYILNLHQGSLSNLQLFADMGDVGGLKACLRAHAERFADLEVEEYSERLAHLQARCESMEAFETEYGEGACLQLGHHVVRELIEMKDLRFSPSKIANASSNRYLARS